jgi:hypothetical protein
VAVRRIQEVGTGSFMDFLERSRKEVDLRIDDRIAAITGGDSIIGDHFHGGKRLRAGTALLTFEALSDGGKGKEMVLDLAAAVEIAHGISLMIDDVLDGDQTRRGVATMHVEKGAPVTMLEAVRMLSIPYSLAAHHSGPVVSHLSNVHEEMVRGAMSEIGSGGTCRSMVSYDRLISMKSGGLFELAARFGALAAGCCEEKASLAGAYGSGLGTVHQFSDDVADLRGALSAGRMIAGSEACLFRLVVEDAEERRKAIGRGRLSDDAERQLERELELRVRRAERAALRIESAIGRCGGRGSMELYLPTMLSAPGEIARQMMPSERSNLRPA